MSDCALDVAAPDNDQFVLRNLIAVGGGATEAEGGATEAEGIAESEEAGEAAVEQAADDHVPRAQRPPIGTVANDALSQKDMLSLVCATVDATGLVGHNITGYNELVDGGGLNRIMTHFYDIDRTHANLRNLTEADRQCKSHQIRIQFNNLRVGRPACTKYLTGQFTDLYPLGARLTGIPYSGALTLGATVTVRASFVDGRVEERTAEIPPFNIGAFPVRVGSTRCHTSNCTRAALKELGEDPSDLGGYFIAKRQEYVVDLLENIRYNSPHFHKQMKGNEHVRAEFLSQPGGAFDNSSQVRLRYMTNGQITIEINSTKFEKVKLPFWLVFRLFGLSDRAAAAAIVFVLEDSGPITARMLDILERAFQLADQLFAPLLPVLDVESLVRMTAERVVSYLTNPNAYQSSESAIAYLNEDLLGSPTRPGGLDKVLLPHMGQTWEARTRKLRYLGLLIHKLLLVHLGALPPTDRDSYRNKRVHGAGVSLAKAFKTQVNNSIVIPITRALRRELKNNPWESITEGSLVDTFRNAVSTSDLNRAMEQAITAGNKTIVVRRRAATNRVSSQALERKNSTNVLSALRTVVTQNAGNASKQTERADMMRRVHPTYVGFICVAQSADTGENVGMRKQLAITAGVCTAGEALPLKLRLLADPAVTPLDLVDSAAMLRQRLARVFVNGEWIGCAASAHALAARYRELRREGRAVDLSTTIAHDPVTDEVEFWLDVGRLRRPLLIVDNNIAEYDASRRARFAWRAADPAARGAEPAAVEFVQNVRFTPAHVRAIVAGELGLADLLREGVLEYITPEEQENCLIAESIVVLRDARHDVARQFSHCDVEQAIFGLAAHVSPYGHHTQPTRVTYETNHARQTGGWYALNFPFRTDKNRFLQFYNEVPLVRTIAHRMIPANGNNVIIAYMSYGGDNQEDSAIVNQAATERGLFAGAFFRYELAELEKGESFACPDRLTTKNLKPNANYEKLVDGFIRRGAVVQYGDVLIGRVARLGRAAAGATAEYQFTDRSVVYRLHEPAVVEDVLQPRGANDELFGVVKLRYERPLRTGDKLSSRSGNKSIVASVLPQSDMPFTEGGITPDLIINTNSIPSRQIIGQLIETTRGVICARQGAVTDGTSFLPVDHRSHAAELVALGYRYNGRERLYNGMTGEYFDAAIVIGPCAEQRLQKFVLDDEQSVAGSGPTDATTGQPLGGKHVHGGLRIGEMEHWGLESHGSMYNLFEKTSQDSDGRVMHVCRGCSALAAYNEFHGVYNCKSCGELADIAAVDGSKSAILFHEELAAANINVRLGLRPRTYEELAADMPAGGAAADAAAP